MWNIFRCVKWHITEWHTAKHKPKAWINVEHIWNSFTKPYTHEFDPADLKSSFIYWLLNIRTSTAVFLRVCCSDGTKQIWIFPIKSSVRRREKKTTYLTVIVNTSKALVVHLKCHTIVVLLFARYDLHESCYYANGQTLGQKTTGYEQESARLLTNRRWLSEKMLAVIWMQIMLNWMNKVV